MQNRSAVWCSSTLDAFSNKFIQPDRKSGGLLWRLTLDTPREKKRKKNTAAKWQNISSKRKSTSNPHSPAPGVLSLQRVNGRCVFSYLFGCRTLWTFCTCQISTHFPANEMFTIVPDSKWWLIGCQLTDTLFRRILHGTEPRFCPRIIRTQLEKGGRRGTCLDLREILFNKAMVLVLMLEDDGVEVCGVRLSVSLGLCRDKTVVHGLVRFLHKNYSVKVWKRSCSAVETWFRRCKHGWKLSRGPFRKLCRIYTLRNVEKQSWTVVSGLVSTWQFTL